MLVIFQSCKKDNEEVYVVFKYTFDEQGERLDNIGSPTTVPSGHATQTPNFQELGVHSIELINYVVSLPTNSTLIYKGEEKTYNGDEGIDFKQEKIISEGETLIKIPVKDIQPGTYTYLRNSLGYQLYEIDFIYEDQQLGTLNLSGTLASFVGFKTYLESFFINGEEITVNDIVNQGYFAFHISSPIAYTLTGNAPATTVPNPLDAVSPIPIGSCLVTGAFDTPLEITGEETEDIIIEVQISINESFEWEDINPDGLYEPAVENVVDMGTRGLKAIILN